MPVEHMSFYALPADDEFPFERVAHVVERHGIPKGARKISEDEAATINSAVLSRTAIPSAIPIAASSVDIKPLLDKIDALSKEVLAQASDIVKVRENTAKAIAQMTEGIGEPKA